MSDGLFPCRTCGTLIGWQSTCEVCKKPVCHNCQGNPEVLPGDYVACKNHVGKVNGMNKIQETKRRKAWGLDG